MMKKEMVSGFLLFAGMFLSAVVFPGAARGQSLDTPVASGSYEIRFRDGWSSAGAQLLNSSAGFPNVGNVNTFQYVCQSGNPKVVSGTVLLRGMGRPVTGGSGSYNHVLMQFNLLSTPPVANFHWYRPADNSHGNFSGTVMQNGSMVSASGYFDASSPNQPMHKGQTTVTASATPVCSTPASPPSTPGSPPSSPQQPPRTPPGSPPQLPPVTPSIPPVAPAQPLRVPQ